MIGSLKFWTSFRRARRPFHPQRLYDWIDKLFFLLLDELPTEAAEDEEGNAIDPQATEPVRRKRSAFDPPIDEAAEDEQPAKDIEPLVKRLKADSDKVCPPCGTRFEGPPSVTRQEQIDDDDGSEFAAKAERIKELEENRRMKDHLLHRLKTSYGQVLHSKGYLWLATFNRQCLQWSQVR